LKQLRFHSNGKFLLSGEYLILKGARGLAIPLKPGQSLSVGEDESGGHTGALTWVAKADDKIWFSAVLSTIDNQIISTSNKEIAVRLREMLNAAHKLNPSVLPHLHNHIITTELDFDINWGLGSSSTLIANLAQLFKINPFDLFFNVSNGSGYDIACAAATTPIIYSIKKQIPEIQSVKFEPQFAEHLYFVYLGQKQISTTSIAGNIKKLENRESEIFRISGLSAQMTKCNTLEEFEQIIVELENITSGVLQIPPIKKTAFTDFEGTVKSLGAWGGDFVMMTWKHSEQALRAYLLQKGLSICIPYNEIVLSSRS
jgi:mevalonate kinase